MSGDNLQKYNYKELCNNIYNENVNYIVSAYKDAVDNISKHYSNGMLKFYLCKYEKVYPQTFNNTHTVKNVLNSKFGIPIDNISVCCDQNSAVNDELVTYDCYALIKII
jgi:uncharacterized membrane protein (UPF0182 family)